MRSEYRNRWAITATVLTSTALFSPALAQRSADPQNETIIVTATKAPQLAAKIGASISVVSAAQIQQVQAISVVDVLRDVPGVAVSRNGGVGSLTSVRIRGAEADQTVLLIDGVKLNDPSSPGGGYDFGNLLVGDIDRIEVLRGPQSTLYGSQAIGGVINIITAVGDGSLKSSGNFEAGSLKSRRAQVSARGKSGSLRYAASFGHFETDGISAAASGTEADSFVNNAAQARLNFVVNEALDIEARAFWSKSNIGIDGFPAPTYAFADTPERSKTEALILYAGAKMTSLGGRLHTRFGLSHTITDRTSKDPTLSLPVTFIASGSNQRADLQTTFDITSNVQIVAGGEIEEAGLTTLSPSTFDPNPNPLRAKNQLAGVFIQGQATPVSWLTATLGVRWTSNDRFGEALNTRSTLAARFNEGTTIARASIANGFKAPTPFQLFSDYGTQSLRPEEASSFEVGIEQAFWDRRVIAAITYFARDTINQIDFISCFGNPTSICTNRPFGTYDNVAKAKADGIEATLEAKPNENLSFSAGYATLDARNDAAGSANFGRALPRRARETAFATIAYRFEFGLDMSASISRVGDSFNNASNTQRLVGYDLVSLRASQKIGDIWSVYARVENAGDETYQTAGGYGAPPRQAFVGLRAQF